ncbi:hypothetical protein PUR34_02460 [Streptomyces sp. JV185]|uniref:hypothetical protein n=1 Tax=Streptomyces sp. JV185 TaxID=858638 RepID=UPI002E79E43C|nr:hypothetical protein [Streptomyces sp. JV185]MEE1767077.1 hypothetical protein [Streptomyces sp. JV185]
MAAGKEGTTTGDASGKTLKVKTCGLLDSSGAPVPELKVGENRTTETDEDGRVTENVQVEPSVPPAT